MASTPTRILLVDDEPALLESMRAYLARVGHTVAAFRDASAAWRHLSGGNSYQVAIVDMTLEGMQGKEFIAKVLERDPAITVLATSGYSTSLLKFDHDCARVATLQKPFTPRMLVDALARLLDGQAGAAG